MMNDLVAINQPDASLPADIYITSVYVNLGVWFYFLVLFFFYPSPEEIGRCADQTLMLFT